MMNPIKGALMLRHLFAIALFASLTLIPTKKAEAGIIIIAGSASTGGMVGGIVLTSAGAVSAGISALFFISAAADGDYLGLQTVAGALFAVPGVVLLALDADGSLPENELVSSLSSRYHFIENSDVIQNIAKTIKLKAGANFQPDEKREVSLSSDEIDTLLAPLDLTGFEAEVASMKKDLE
jgi:hypothetical protein